MFRIHLNGVLVSLFAILFNSSSRVAGYKILYLYEL